MPESSQYTTENVCRFCGRELEEKTVEANGVSVHLGAAPCRCPGATAAASILECRGARDAMGAEAASRLARYERSGIPPKFIDADADVTAGFDAVLSGSSLYLHGDNGTGKTTYASVLARTLVDEGRLVRFTSSSRMKSELFSTGNGLTEEDLFGRWSGAWLLVIDDIGKECDNKAVVPMLYRVINERDEQMLPTVVTSNFRLSELGAKLAACGDVSCAKAIASRLAGMTRMIRFDGPDMRLSGRKKEDR